MNLKQRLLRMLSNLPGWRTRRKIVVIESDDWGSVRMPSVAAYERLKALGIDVDGGSARYNQNDTLARKEDLQALFAVLKSFTGRDGRAPVFTAMSLVANPDFERIKQADFKEYYFEPFTQTLDRYGYGEAFSAWKEGIQQGVFIPQFHGREHLNVAVWLRALQDGDKATMTAFEERCWGFNNQHSFGISYQAAFDLEKQDDLPVQESIIQSGLALFEQLFDFQASVFVPPNGPFNNSLEQVAAQYGISYMGASKIQREPLGQGQSRRVLHYLGQQNKNGQHYLTRNCFFEPADQSKDWVESCLAEINSAFNMRKPAVISSHRINYIGGLKPENREQGLAALSQLLERIVERWPEVEFMSSNELGDLVSGRA